MTRQRIRFAFTIPTQAPVGLTSGAWMLWVKKEDTYIACAGLADTWKISLHGDVAWRLAVTREHLTKPNPLWTEPDRAPWKFEPTPFVEGGRLAFAIAAARGALRPEPLDEAYTHIAVADRWDQLTIAYVWMTEPGVPLDAPRLIGGPLRLSNGRGVWVSAGTEAIEPIDPEPIPISGLVEPMWPEKHGVNAPGVLLRGVHLDPADAV